MSRSLHPDAGSSRFNYKAWLAKNQQDFERTYGYKADVTEAQHTQRLDKQLARLDRAGLPLDCQKVTSVGKYQAYSSEFWKGMGQVERGVRQGKIFTANQAYDQLKETIDAKLKNRDRVGEEKVREPNIPNERGQSERHSSTSVKVTPPDKAAARSANEGKPATGKASSDNEVKAGTRTKQQDRPGRVSLSPLLAALRFESVPETGDQVQSQEDDYRRRLKRRR